ncbi:PPOX class F420-dependent oxidoreductase [Haloechinothrix sp. YIM 98757]|uniref:PPOX class F420-dependent oxidoreductase n=1 Tax=Haloechinothrix aidingensis TaxID=2752311 RepID=A0A837ZZ27_9PSEU|nr:PPOX class F420-dependent oxidoreductase [Haloechinothrix aidingensis]MBA0125866.1 PPOX class F420-dependent oxidoreductase [Haloechinothrix aidingensis]
MEVSDAVEVLREKSRAVLATMRADGTPQMSPVLATVDDAGAVLISTREHAYKVRNLRRDPRAWLCVLPEGFFGDWVQVEGTARITQLPEAMDGLIEYYRRLSGEHPDWEEYRRAMRQEERVLVTLAITRAGPDRSG